MTSAEALRLVAAAARVGQLRYTNHALDEMAEAHAREVDVEHTCMTATVAQLQANGVWRLDGGTDRAGDALTVCVTIKHDIVVITVF